MKATERKPRQIHWTCRKCRAKWSSDIPEPPAGGERKHHGDSEMQTICDACLDRMGSRTLNRY